VIAPCRSAVVLRCNEVGQRPLARLARALTLAPRARSSGAPFYASWETWVLAAARGRSQPRSTAPPRRVRIPCALCTRAPSQASGTWSSGAICVRDGGEQHSASSSTTSRTPGCTRTPRPSTARRPTSCCASARKAHDGTPANARVFSAGIGGPCSGVNQVEQHDCSVCSSRPDESRGRRARPGAPASATPEFPRGRRTPLRAPPSASRGRGGYATPGAWRREPRRRALRHPFAQFPRWSSGIP
jgi:hypothetical protein